VSDFVKNIRDLIYYQKKENGVIRFITKLIKRNDESPVETKPIRQSERVVHTDL